ncbi:low temperature requirement protein A [Micromonospora sp. NPDC000207]|uniref:low temperature requirement protein A n=1 Tax=Micromonospora sp. NPDC000207 TaxID=3154246 RepID=UPI00331F34FC
MGGERWRGHLGPAVAVAPGARVDRFEIFFDLVFVFSFFIIVRAAASDVSPHTLLHGLLVLALLWWIWILHSVVATRVRLGEGFVPVVMVIGMAALFAFALAVPQTIAAHETGQAGPATVALSYLVIRVVHLWVYGRITRDNPGQSRDLHKLTPELLVSTGLLLAAALLPPLIDDSGWSALVRDGLLVAVVLTQYATGLLVGIEHGAVPSAEHWTERYDLILMIALGESVLSVGLGTSTNLGGAAVNWPAITGGSIGIILAATLWWLHFDMVGPAARIALHATTGRARGTMARDAYAYLFLPMIAGLIMLSLGAEEILKVLLEPSLPAGAKVHASGVLLLYGGVICYLLGDMAFQARTLRTLTWARLGTVLLVAALIPVGLRVSALLALVLVTAVCLALVTWEVVWMADARRALRDVVFAERIEHERREVEIRARWHDDPPQS